MTFPKRPRTFWPSLLEQAAVIVTGRGSTTLRQLHYLLASDPGNEYRNTRSDYQQLSSRTAEARRAGWFPALAAVTDVHHHGRGVTSIQEHLEHAYRSYSRWTAEGQDNELWVIVEKATLLGFARDWTSAYGASFASLGGYGSQTAIDEVAAAVAGVDAAWKVALYVGDYDPSGVDIERDFLERVGGVFDEVRRIAVTREHVAEYDLPPAPAKTGDPRSAAFALEHGEAIQVEVESFEVFHPEALSELVTDALESFTDMAKVVQVHDTERADRARLREFIDTFN